MEFEWDGRKAVINFRKHGIAFPFAAQIFKDENRTEKRDENEDYGEVRWLTTGLIDEVEFVVVYTIRDQKIRIISARRANSHERKAYWNR